MVNVLNKQLTEMTGETSYTTETLGNYPLYALEIYGKSTQGYASCGGTPLGKNLLSLNQNYEISTPQSICSNLPITLQEGTTYTFSYVSSSFISNSSINTTLTYNDGTSGFLSTLNIQQGLNSFDFTCAKPVTKISLYANVSTATTFSNLQIELGSTATSYEPYYSNPNPDCPVDIVSVGDDGAVEITSCGKNLFDFEAWKTGITSVFNGTAQYGDNSVKLTATANDCFTSGTNQFAPSHMIKVEPNTQYTLSWVADNDNVGYVYVFFDGKTNNAKAQNNADTKHFTFTTLNTSTYIQIRLGVKNSGESITYRNILLEEGTTATSYEPYMGNTAFISSALPLCSVGDVRDELIYNADGTGKIIKRTKQIIADGTNVKAVFMSVNAETGITQWRLFYDNTLANDLAICSHLVYLRSAVPTSEHFFVVKDGNNTYVRCYINSSTIGTTSSKINAWLAAQNNAGTPFTVIATLLEPQEIELSAAEVALLQQLQTFEGVTNLYNNGNGKMYVRAMTAGFEYGHEVGFFDSKI